MCTKSRRTMKRSRGISTRNFLLLLFCFLQQSHRTTLKRSTTRPVPALQQNGDSRRHFRRDYVQRQRRQHHDHSSYTQHGRRHQRQQQQQQQHLDATAEAEDGVLEEGGSASDRGTGRVTPPPLRQVQEPVGKQSRLVLQGQ